MVQLTATTDATSERRLARALGYPKTWHVVRGLVPNPSIQNGGGAVLVQDRIFAGDPAQNADLYCNHGAAFGASLRWDDDESTPYDDNGGHMLTKEPRYASGRMVQVLFDDEWYDATVTKVQRKEGDVKYSIIYTADNTYQNNVTEDEMREKPTSQKKKKKQQKMVQKAAPAPKSTSKSRRKAAGGDNDAAGSEQSDLDLAADMGFPAGWSVSEKKNSNFVIYSPGRKKRFTSKRSAYEAAGLEMPPSSKKARIIAYAEEDDPPWRIDGHEYMGRQVLIRPEGATEELKGTVVGWIADTDVDRAGEPGFISTKTGQAAFLFHVSFDSDAAVESQDCEEYELIDNFV